VSREPIFLLLLLLLGAKMFVDPEGFLDQTNQVATALHTAVEATFGWRLQFQEKPLKHSRRLAIGVRVVGGALVALGTLAAYSLMMGL